MLCVSNMLGLVASAILLSTVTDFTHGLYVPHPELQRAVVHKKVIATWDEAKLRCKKEGAMLASPVNTGLLEYIKSSIGVNNHTTPYFIGMRLIDNPEHTVILSVEGIPLDDLPQAALDMIEQIDPQDGDCLRMDSHDIRTGPCQNRLPYICYKNGTTDTTTTSTTTQTSISTTTSTTTPTTTPTVTSTTTSTPTSTVSPTATSTTTSTTTPSTTPSTTQFTTPSTSSTTTSAPAVTTEITTTESPVDCTSGYTKLSTGYYKLHKESADWDKANSTCTSEGGYLVVLNNEEEARTIMEYFFPLTSDASYILVGVLDRIQDGGWHSVNGELLDQLYHSWASSRSFFPEACGALKYTGSLDDMKCEYGHPFICEKSCLS